MFSKLLFIVLTFGMVGGCLLIMRQQRLEASHQTATTFQRVAAQERAVWRMRAEIARRCRPDQLQQLREELSESWTPFSDPPRSTIDDMPESELDLIDELYSEDIDMENLGG